MPRYERAIVVFVASPSDLAQEREKLEEVIEQLNLTWSGQFSMRLNLVRWETHAVPGIGTDSQDVINNDIPDDIDIFIGMMWGKYGTPTGRAGSGTEEEFKNALARYRKNQKSIRIMFYFKDAPLPPSQIDTDQLARVQEFKSELGPKGTLYWSFNTLDEFERHITIHLSRQIQYFHRQPDEPTPNRKPLIADANATSEESDELGLLDYLDIAETNIGSLIEIAGRISHETETIGQRIAKRTDEINAAVATKGQPLGRVQARSLINRVALDMNIYVTRLNGELPLFDQRLNEGAAAAAQVALITSDVASNDRQQVKTALEQLTTLSDSLDYASVGLTGFRESVLSLPRMTSDLNRAKRETANILQSILNSMESARGVITETVLSMENPDGPE